MKKIYLIIALSALFLQGFAQENKVNLPEKGDFSIEIGFNPFSNSFETFKLDEGILQARYFAGSKDALIFRLGLGYADIDYGKWYDRISATEWGLGLGYERHWFPSSRIDLYGGALFQYSAMRASGKWDSDKPEFDKYSAALLTGINFYVVKGLYLGAEVGIGFEHYKVHDSDENANALQIKARPSLSVGWTF